MIAGQFAPLGYQQITALSTAAALAVPAGANFALIRVETANVRWRDDGVAPTASVGVPMLDTDPPLAYSGSLADIRFVAETGSPVLNVAYYRIS